MPLPPDLAALIVSGNVSYRGQTAKLTALPSAPTVDEIGITFGEYPALAQSSFGVSASISDVVLKSIPQPDVEPFGASASLKSISLLTTANYITTGTGTDAFGASASLKSISLLTTANYITTGTGTDAFGASASLKSISLLTTANYAEHVMYDKEQFGPSASLKSISLITV
jgi:hypothetical protein